MKHESIEDKTTALIRGSGYRESKFQSSGWVVKHDSVKQDDAPEQSVTLINNGDELQEEKVMNKTAENFLKAQDKLMIDTIALLLKAETHKKHSDILLKKQMEEAIRGEGLPKIKK